MTTIAIELNDAGITAADRERVLVAEPGYALVEAGRIVTGVPAFRQARLRPAQINNRYWSELSLARNPDGRSNADYAFAQLRDIWERCKAAAADAILVVPSHYDRTQLGLLLGLAEECRLPVRALVDVAAAASSRPYPNRQLMYVDAGLHRVSVTPLRQDTEVTALEERGLAGAGIASLDDIFAKRIAEIFVLATRFDPFHGAESEQVLYDRLPDWLEQLRDAESSELTLAFGAQEFRAEVKHSHLVGAASGFYKALVQLIAQTREPGAALVVGLGARLARQPGLVEELGRLDESTVVVYELGHAARAALEALDSIPRGGQVKLLRHLAWRDRPVHVATTTPKPATPASSAGAPTHVVYRGVGYPVNGGGLLVGRAPVDDRRTIVVDDTSGGISRSHCEIGMSNGELVVRDLSSHGTFVNEKRVSGEVVLRPADVIRVGSPGEELELIRVER